MTPNVVAVACLASPRGQRRAAGHSEAQIAWRFDINARNLGAGKAYGKCRLKEMKRALIFCALVSAPASADLPFGFDIETGPRDLPHCAEHQGEAGWYRCSEAPAPRPSLHSYEIKWLDGVGVCGVQGIGETISTNPDGAVLRAKTDEIAAEVEREYGQSTLYDGIATGAVHGGPDEWMRGLIEKERLYLYAWWPQHGFEPAGEITSISVSAEPLSTSEGVVVAEFVTQRDSECEKRMHRE